MDLSSQDKYSGLPLRSKPTEGKGREQAWTNETLSCPTGPVIMGIPIMSYTANLVRVDLKVRYRSVNFLSELLGMKASEATPISIRFPDPW